MSAAQAIANGIVKLLAEYTGRGPTHARTHMNGDLVSVVLRDALTKAERRLIAAGHRDAVLDMRRRLQSALRDEAVAIVEAATGREVEAFMSDNLVDPDLAIETFILKPA